MTTIKMSKIVYNDLVSKRIEFVERLLMIVEEMGEENYDELDKRFFIIMNNNGEGLENEDSWSRDNLYYIELCREMRWLNKCIQDLDSLIINAEIIGTPSDCNFLQIGHLANITIDDGQVFLFRIVGCCENDANGSPQKVEYCSPLIRGLIGKEVDEVVVVEIGGVKKEVALKGIFLEEFQDADSN